MAKTLNVTGDALLGLEHPNNNEESSILRTYRNLNVSGRVLALELLTWLEETPKYSDNSALPA